jgi:hypothetical protein
VIRKSKNKPKKNSKKKHAPSNNVRISDQGTPNAFAYRTSPPVVRVPNGTSPRPKTGAIKNKAKSFTTLEQANGVLDIIIRTAVMDAISTLKYMGILPSRKKTILGNNFKYRQKNERRAFKKAVKTTAPKLFIGFISIEPN